MLDGIAGRGEGKAITPLGGWGGGGGMTSPPENFEKLKCVKRVPLF